MAIAGSNSPEENTPIFFPSWKSALAQSGLPGAVQSSHDGEIRSFLRFCKGAHTVATVALARHYVTRFGAGESPAREALRWFVRASRRSAPPECGPEPASDAGSLSRLSRVESACNRGTAVAGSVPRVAREDLGGADWERDLISALRRRGFLWRTEQTYRGWAGRFAEHLRPRSPYAVEGADVAAFLSKLAVEQRASASTQKQALNALVFLLQEALHRSVGEFEFQRARGQVKVYAGKGDNYGKVVVMQRG